MLHLMMTRLKSTLNSPLYNLMNVSYRYMKSATDISWRWNRNSKKITPE